MLSFLRRTKAEWFVVGVQKALCVQRLRISGLEAVHARPAQLCAREVDRARLHGEVNFLEDRQRVVPALQKLVERRSFLRCTFWSIGSKVLIMLDSGHGLTRRLNLKKRRARAINL